MYSASGWSHSMVVDKRRASRLSSLDVALTSACKMLQIEKSSQVMFAEYGGQSAGVLNPSKNCWVVLGVVGQC
jgi:hypothetical protein